MAATPAHRPRILVTRKLMPDVEARLQRDYAVTLNPRDTPMTADQIVAAAAALDGLVVTSMDSCRAALLERLPPNIKIIATVSVGYDHVEIPVARARGIAVTNTPDVLTDATADIAILLMLGAARGAHWGSRMIAENNWKATTMIAPLGLDVSGRRLGILGMGRIGQAVARRAAGFGMQLHYHNRSALAAEKAHGARFHGSFEAMLPQCDFLSINCASTPATRKLIDARVLGLLPRGAILVNSARGDIVDDDALFAALDTGQLAAAGLDVYRGEPAIDARFRDHPKLFLLPHLGSATPDTRTAMGLRAADNLDAHFAGGKPRDLLTV